MKKILFIGLILSLILLTGCTKTIAEITANDDYVGKVVMVKGTAQNAIKLGELSGYTLVDANSDKIIVASPRLPAEEDKVTARGTLKKMPLGIGYYIESVT